MNRLKATPGDQPSDKDKTNVATSSGHFLSQDEKRQEVSIDFGSRLTLLHVYQLPLTFGTTSGPYRNTELLQDRHVAEEKLKAQGALVRAAYPNCEWIMHSGDPGKGILEVALKLGADLIVISSHHHHWYDRYRPTNIADYILCHATCAILEVSDSGESFLNCLNSAGRVKFHEWGVATK